MTLMYHATTMKTLRHLALTQSCLDEYFTAFIQSTNNSRTWIIKACMYIIYKQVGQN